METDCTVYEQWALLLGASLAITCSCLKNTTEQVNFIKEEEEEKEKKQSPILTWKQKKKWKWGRIQRDRVESVYSWQLWSVNILRWASG